MIHLAVEVSLQLLIRPEAHVKLLLDLAHALVHHLYRVLQLVIPDVF